MDSSSKKDQHLNHEIHNLEDNEELDDEEEMHSPKDIDLNGTLKAMMKK